MAIENGPTLKMENPLTENGEFSIACHVRNYRRVYPFVIKEVPQDAN